MGERKQRGIAREKIDSRKKKIRTVRAASTAARRCETADYMDFADFFFLICAISEILFEYDVCG